MEQVDDAVAAVLQSADAVRSGNTAALVKALYPAVSPLLVVLGNNRYGLLQCAP